MKKLFLTFILSCINILLNAQIPTLYLKGNFGYDYQEGEVNLYIPDTNENINLHAQIKWRGGSTNSANKHKRNYKIKFDGDISLFGFRKDNKWILDAGQADVFRLRNRIATELWNDFASKPYYFSKEPEALTGVRGKVIEVYLNNEYMGIYCLTEAMDRKQMKLKKFNKTTGEIHGGLWKSVGWGTSLMWNTVPYNNSSDTWDVFEVKYPDLDDLDETDYSTLYNAINFVATSSNKDFKEHIHEYFDIPVIIDYYLFLNVLNAYDNTGKNMYWAVYDKQIDKKLTLAVWDLDGTVGQKWIEKWVPNATSPEVEVQNNLNLIYRLKTLDVDNFNQKAIQRYHELRKTFFSTQSLVNRYKQYYELIKYSGAVEREEQRWSGDSDVDNNIIDFESEINFIINWIEKHMEFLDNKIFPIETNTNILNDIIDINKTTIIYNLQGQPVTTPNRGVYIVNGHKYVIK